MTAKPFRYPPIFHIVKVQIKVMMVLIPVLLIALLRSEYNISQEEFRLAILTIILTIIGGVYIVGSLCEIKTDTDGLYVEFFWKYLFVPWEKIKGIRYIGFRPFGYWIVVTENSLTIVHRLYAIGTLPLLPSFHIHEKLESRSMLLSLIKSKILFNTKNNK
jgi:hypothetical protein